jgi:predicted amidohydrolase
MEKKSKSLKILAIQMSSIIADKWENFSKIADLIEKNIKKGTDIIVLPEVWNVGWKPSEFEDSAEDLEDSETIEFLSELAQRYKVNIIGGSLIRKGKRGKEKGKGNSSLLTPNSSLYNTCPVINRDGELVATYDKMHLFSYYGCDEGTYIENGTTPVLIDIDGVKIGLSICYDIRFPEIYRAYRKAGADLLINIAAWPKSRAVHWEALSKARAIENQCFMLALTQSGLIEKEEYNLGHSRIIDYNGEVVAEITQDEGAMSAEIKFDEMYEFRGKCTVLNDICCEYDIKI